jgi:polyisoprenyl-phosphate glycosyltransferase
MVYEGENVMKKISILIPSFNEEDNVVLISSRLVNIFNTVLSKYDYEIVFIDNYSTDSTRQKIRLLCTENSNIKAIFNAKNFGHIRSPYHGMCQTTGDCTIFMCCDLQDPPEMITKFIEEWENGNKIVVGIKNKSKENKLMYFFRSIYYKAIKKMAEVEQIEHFTGFGLYDKQFIEVMNKLDDPMPYLRGIVSELGFQRKEIKYEQQKRIHGKTKNNWYTLYDIGMLGITSYSKVLMRFATIIGFSFSAVSLVIALIYFVLKILFWDKFPMGLAPILIGVFLIGSIQIFFIGLLGEYILNINTRVMKRPLVVEEERINF